MANNDRYFLHKFTVCRVTYLHEKEETIVLPNILGKKRKHFIAKEKHYLLRNIILFEKLFSISQRFALILGLF